MNRAKLAIASAALAHFLAWAVSLYFAFYPCVYEGATVTTQSGVTIREIGCSGSLVTVNGLRVLLVLAVPVAITGLGLFATISNMVTYEVARILLWASGISMLQSIRQQTFWLAGRNAPSRGEAFRVRISRRDADMPARRPVRRNPLHTRRPGDDSVRDSRPADN